MLRLRLFRKTDLSSQIDTRLLGEGELVIGRDAKADWPIDDPDRGISRRHLVIAERGGLVTVRDTSSNGVFLGTGRERLQHDRPTPVERGEQILFGGYVLVPEDEGREVAEAPPPIAADAPFDRPGGRVDDDGASRRERHPFASAIRPDPLTPGGEVGSTDAWERRPEAPAGSWEAGRHRKPEHTTMIGADRPWTEPPPAAPRDAGYGFDTPFERPVLERPVVPPDAAAIPSDWMEAAPASAPADVPPYPQTLPPAADPVPSAAAPTPVEIAPPPPPPVVPELVLSDPLPIAPVAPVPSPPEPAPSPGPARDALAAAPAAGDDALFQHFCAGAGINPRQFAGEDRARIMERLGGVYRQAVLGIADLMRERTTLRNEYRMVHTAVQPEGNNPFKWVPPQRIATELLREEDGGYTTGEQALNDALHDVKAHLLCTLAGMRAALSATFAALSPGQAEARLGGKGYLMAVQRDAALWAEYVAMADALRVEAEDNPDGLVNRAFREGYEEQAAELISGARPWR